MGITETIVTGIVGISVAGLTFAIGVLITKRADLRQIANGFKYGVIGSACVLLLGWLMSFAANNVVVSNHEIISLPTRSYVTRDDVRRTIQQMEDRVPDTLQDMEDRVPDIMADMEREMMKNASKYGLSTSDIRSQLRDIERQTRENIRNMEGDVRQNIRDLEEPVWEQLQRY